MNKWLTLATMSERLIVVSTDCHAGLPIADYKPYVESKYHEMMDMAVPVTIDMMEKAESTFLIKEINDAWRAPIPAVNRRLGL